MQSSANIITVIKSRVICGVGAYGIQWGEKGNELHTGFWLANLQKEDHLEDLHIHLGGWGHGLDSSALGYEAMKVLTNTVLNIRVT
jgi:hypothetical protein